jgi:GT2 family glycosyltransferase
MNPPAAIVIPLLRQRDEWLMRAIASALEQTVTAEVIVITSPHTPASNLAVVERARATAAGRLMVETRTGTGFANAMNTGLGLVRASRVGFLLSDDWLEPTAIEECLAIDADIVSTGAIRVAECGRPLPHLRRALAAEEFAKRRTFEQQATYLTHFFLLRRAKLAEIGGLDERLGDAPGIDDYDLIWTLLEHGASVGLTNRPLYNLRIHAGERLTMRSGDAQLLTLERIFDKHGLTGAARERRIREHARWFGRPEDVVFEEIHGEPG